MAKHRCKVGRERRGIVRPASALGYLALAAVKLALRDGADPRYVPEQTLCAARAVVTVHTVRVLNTG